MCLEAGFDSKHLRMLAATSPNDWPSMTDEIERKARAELGWDEIPRYVYLLEYARLLASDILNGRVDNKVASRRIYDLMREADLFDELSGWYEIDEMLYSLEHFERTGNKDHFYCEPAEFDRIVNEHCKDFLVRSDPKTATLPETGFDEAESIFADFLVNNRHNGKVTWVFAEDLIIRQGKLDCYLPDPDRNREFARRLYDAGVMRGHGLALHVFAKLDDRLLGYIQLPDDALDSQHKLMSEHFVKFSVRTNLRYIVTEVNNPIIWKIKNFFISDRKRVGYEDEIPFRNKANYISTAQQLGQAGRAQKVRSLL